MSWRFTVALMICGLMLAARPAAAQATSGGVKAKLSLDDAVAAAKKWAPDAILTSISSTAVDKTGAGGTWFYGFYSRKNDSYLNVTATNGEVTPIPVGEGRTAPVASGFLDSDLAMRAAVKEGLKGDNPTMLLTGSTWIITGGQDKGNSILVLSARTGRVIRQSEVE